MIGLLKLFFDSEKNSQLKSYSCCTDGCYTPFSYLNLECSRKRVHSGIVEMRDNKKIWYIDWVSYKSKIKLYGYSNIYKY